MILHTALINEKEVQNMLSIQGVTAVPKLRQFCYKKIWPSEYTVESIAEQKDYGSKELQSRAALTKQKFFFLSFPK